MKKYNLKDLVDQCDLTQETSEELKAWESAPEVGTEVPASRCEEDWGQLGK